jgi:hypothetical protein
MKRSSRSSIAFSDAPPGRLPLTQCISAYYLGIFRPILLRSLFPIMTDGNIVSEEDIPLLKDGGRHEVQVVLGTK